MDRDVIDSKLESLRRAVNRVATWCPGSAEELLANVDAQDIVSLNLTRAIQLCVDIGTHLLTDLEAPVPETMGATFITLSDKGILDTELASRLRRAVGFRNLAVHHYRAIDWQTVHALAKKRLVDFSEFAIAVQNRVESQARQDPE
jgi:uncharacterized protein YutE (UPF0331/DUF86 family)